MTIRLIRLLAALGAMLWASALLAQEPVFEIDRLNPGLGEAPAMLDRDTPMGAMESFVHLTDRQRYGEAAHLLDLGGLPEDVQAEEGANLVRQLAVIIERKAMIPWGDLPDRPDGWHDPRSQDGTGRVQRSISLALLDTGSHDVPLRLNRVQPSGGDPVWVVSRQSVENIPALYRRYGPTAIEQSLPSWLRARAFWGMYVWEVLFVPLLLALAAALGYLVYRAVDVLGKRADTRLSRAVVRALRWPAVIAVTTGVVGYATREVLVVSGLLDSIISPAVLCGYILAITLGALMVIDEIFDNISRSTPEELADPENRHLRNVATTMSAARKTVIVIAVLMALGFVLTSINSFQSLGLALLASAGAVRVVLGFAAREVLGNILASVQIALNRSARIGDQLIFEGHYCTVERIHFTYVQLQIWNGNRYVVPVSRFVSDAFENWSLEDIEMIRPIILTLAQGADVEALRDFFLNSVEQDDGDETGPVEKAAVEVIDQDVFGKKVRFSLPTPHASTGWEMQCKMRERLLDEARRLQEEKGAAVLPSDTIRDMPEA